MKLLTKRALTKLAAMGLVSLVAYLSVPMAVQAQGKPFDGKKITVLNWQGYGTDEPWAVKAFTEKTGIKVVHDYFSSEAEMLTKLRTNPGVYDVVLTNGARVAPAVAEGLLAAVDLSVLKNSAGLEPQLRDSPSFKINGKTYSTAWVWGMTGLAMRNSVKEPASYTALADPAFKGRLALFDDAVTAVALGALMSGQDMNNPPDLAAVKAKLESLKPNVKLLWSSEDQWNKAFAAGEFDIALFWSGASVRSAQAMKLPVKFVVPKEGAIGWIDGLSIPASSKNVGAAQAFIDYMIDPAFYVEWSTKVGAPASANSLAMAKLPAKDLNASVHNVANLKGLVIQGPLPDARREAFNNLWQQVKASYAK